MYTFETHLYSPEQNKVFLKGIDISKHFSSTVLSSLCNDYKHNIQVVRKSLSPFKGLRAYKLVATRLNGTTETRFCNVGTCKEALDQLKKAKQYYNIEGTKIEFKRLYKY